MSPPDIANTAERTPHSPSRLATWLQLLRVPNLPTVPGDPLVGYVLAAVSVGEAVAWHKAALAAGAALLLYAAGLLANDFFDLAEDRRERPSRPLPSGRASPAAVIVVSGLLATWGVVAAFLATREAGMVALLLALCIYAYDGGLKRLPVVGPGVMGLCRGLSVLMGAAAAAGSAGIREPASIAPAALIAAYVVSVTAIARRETGAAGVGQRRNAPLFVLAFAYTFLVAPILQHGTYKPASILLIVLAALAVGWTGWWAIRLGGRPEPATVQKAVGRLVGGLIFVQASLAAMAALALPDVIWLAVGLLVLCPISWLLARKFYGS